MAETPATLGSAPDAASESSAADSTALSEIANNGAMLNQVVSTLSVAVDSLQDITLPADNGGTGHNSYAIGDLLTADTTTTLARLADVATGNALISGGVDTMPSWGKVTPSHFSGTLPVANGGTGATSFTAYAVLCGGTTTTNPIQPIAGLGSAGQLLTSNGAGVLPSMQSRAAADSDYRGNTSNVLFLTPNTVWNAAAFVALTTSSASIPVNMNTGFNFSGTITQNSTLANPTNAKPGQAGVFKITTSGGTFTVAVSANYLKTASLPFPVSITSGQTAYFFYFVDTSSRIIITSVVNNPT